MKNYKYKYKKNKGWGGYTKKIATKKELDEARETALKLSKNEAYIGMRSCWVCNEAHSHFLIEWGKWVLSCFECGHWYYDGIDITKG